MAGKTNTTFGKPCWNGSSFPLNSTMISALCLASWYERKKLTNKLNQQEELTKPKRKTKIINQVYESFYAHKFTEPNEPNSQHTKKKLLCFRMRRQTLTRMMRTTTFRHHKHTYKQREISSWPFFSSSFKSKTNCQLDEITRELPTEQKGKDTEIIRATKTTTKM